MGTLFFTLEAKQTVTSSCVDKVLRVNPPQLGGRGRLCSTKANVFLRAEQQSAAVDPHRACRKPRTRTTSTLWDKQDTRESHGDKLKDNVSSEPLVSGLLPHTSHSNLPPQHKTPQNASDLGKRVFKERIVFHGLVL